MKYLHFNKPSVTFIQKRKNKLKKKKITTHTHPQQKPRDSKIKQGIKKMQTPVTCAVQVKRYKDLG